MEGRGVNKKAMWVRGEGVVTLSFVIISGGDLKYHLEGKNLSHILSFKRTFRYVRLYARYTIDGYV